MLNFRKGLLLTLLIATIGLLTSCDYDYYLYHEYIRKETKVENIELVNYNNPIVLDNPLEKFPFDLEKLEILETLNTDKIDEFLNELFEIGGLSNRLKEVISSPNGIGVRIMYIDGGFTLITVSIVNDKNAIYVGHYDANSEIEGYYGISWTDMINDFNALIKEYFNIIL